MALEIWVHTSLAPMLWDCVEAHHWQHIISVRNVLFDVAELLTSKPGPAPTPPKKEDGIMISLPSLGVPLLWWLVLIANLAGSVINLEMSNGEWL